MNSPELKPCPFCGEQHDIAFYDNSRLRYEWSTWVECDNCNARGPNATLDYGRSTTTETREKAAEAWNVLLGRGGDE